MVIVCTKTCLPGTNLCTKRCLPGTNLSTKTRLPRTKSREVCLLTWSEFGHRCLIWAEDRTSKRWTGQDFLGGSGGIEIISCFRFIIGQSEVHATSGANLGRPLFLVIGPSGVRALPLAAGINVGGHYFR